MGSRRVHRVLLLVATAAAIAIALATHATHVLRRAELSTVDLRFAVRGEQRQPAGVVFVAIDSASITELDRWPFPRGRHAEVISRLRRAGARVIAYDVQFTEPSADPRQDDLLIEAVRRAGNVVLATTEVGANGTTSIFGGADGLRYSRGIPAASTFPNDPGGVIRRVDRATSGLESFPLAAARRALGRRVAFPGGGDAPAWIDFTGPPGSIRTVSFADVYKGRFAPQTFRGRVVVVGSSAVSLQDFHPTSTTGQALMAGPEIQAAAIDTAMRGFPLRPVPGWVDVLAIVLLALPALVGLRGSALRGVAATVASCGAFAVGAQIAFDQGRIVAVVDPLLAAALATAAMVVLQAVTSAFEREQVRQVFARFVPDAVVGQVLDRAGGARLGGTLVEGTVMFSDLRGFTSFSERRDPELVLDVLNRYLTAMSDAILDHGGTLVSFMGDGIMALFGAPLEQPDHRDRAVAAARDMLARMAGFNAWMRDQGHGDGFKMGIGLNSGGIMSGNVGSERRLEYTAIGDTTNTAARIEGLTKGTPYQLFVADSTYRGLAEPGPDLVPAGAFEIRGREERLTIWALAAISEPAQSRPSPVLA